MIDILSRLPAVLPSWYEAHKRDLPWRRDREPYHVWLSEIMLQQTRVEAVKGYYARFLQQIPSIQALAVCEDDKLHKLWEGLGYYSRVRNLKKAAVEILSRYGGAFPKEYDHVRALPGIGDYTAGAICSICYDLPTPAVDGNVLRLVSRLCDDATPIQLPAQKRKIRDALAQVYPERAGEFTQALMELGATVCGPNRQPDCPACPCKEFCLGQLHGTAAALPVKMEKKQRRVENKTVLILCFEGQYALMKRPETGLLADLWQFPELDGTCEVQEAISWLQQQGVSVKEVYRQSEKTHIFTHVQWNMRGIYLECANREGPWIWLTAQQIREQIPLPTAYRQFWDDPRE